MLQKLLEALQALRCPHHLPGPLFPWHRCQYGCSWCDYMQSWLATPPRSPHSPPYR